MYDAVAPICLHIHLQSPYVHSKLKLSNGKFRENEPMCRNEMKTETGNGQKYADGMTDVQQKLKIVLILALRTRT